MGHLKKNCPETHKKIARVGALATNTTGNVGQLEGIILINTQPISVVYDTGASHSLISLEIVKKLALACVSIEQPLTVHSP